MTKTKKIDLNARSTSVATNNSYNSLNTTKGLIQRLNEITTDKDRQLQSFKKALLGRVNINLQKERSKALVMS
jgi:hypothetical protein